MSDPQKATAAVTQTTQDFGLLDQIVEQGRLARDPSARERGKDMVKEFV
jgi:type VI secretion system protein ImpC